MTGQIETDETEFAGETGGKVPEMTIDPKAVQKQDWHALAAEMQTDGIGIQPQHLHPPVACSLSVPSPLPEFVPFVYQVSAPHLWGATVIIDVFNHFMPRSYLDRLAALVPDHVAVKAFPRLDTLVDVEARLQLVEEFEGLQQVLSLANPPLELIGPPAISIELARIANDGLAEICRRHPRVFPAFVAALPMNDVDASLREIDRAVGELGARGVQVFTNVAGRPLSEPEFRPVFRRMAEHDLPVWVHPMRGPNFPDYATESASEDEIWFSFGWPYETTACMTRLIYSGLFDELPTLKVISHHMGGMIPYFPAKIKLGFRQIFFGTPQRNPVAEERGLKRPPLDYYKMLYADTALGGEEAATRCGHAFFGTARCLFATDAPFDPTRGRALISDSIRGVRSLGLLQHESDAIFAGNARVLLKL